MREQTTREAFALNNTIIAVKIEANALYDKHGPMPAEVEDIRFHVQRAMHTLEAALYAYPWDAARILDRLEHLGAVCVRGGVAVRGLQAMEKEPEA